MTGPNLEDEMQAVFATAAVAILVVDDAGRIRSANPAAATLLTASVDELVGQTIADVLPEYNPGTVLADGHSSTVYLGREGTGDELVVQFRVTGWKTKNDQERFTVVLNDVTRSINVEHELRETLQRWDHALIGARIGVFEVDIVTGKSIVSETWKRLMGLDPKRETDAQAEWMSRVHPDDLILVQRADRDCIKGRTSRSLTDYRIKKPHGRGWRWMRSDAIVAERDADGKALRLIGAQTDITDEKITEEALRVSIQQFQSAFDNAPIGKAIVGLDGSWLKVNAALCNLLGFTEEQLMAADFQSVTHPDDIDADMAEVEKLLTGSDSSYRIEKRYLRADGAVIWGILSVALVRDRAGKPIHFISQVVDITEQRRLDHIKSEFVATVSHELRTPLTSILGSLSLVEATRSEELSDETNRLLYIAQQNAQRLRQLVNDILDIERLASQKMRFDLSIQRVAELLEQSVLTNLPLADEFGVRFVLDSSDRDLRCTTDPERFQQIMTNLLSNAAKFSDKGGTVELRCDDVDEHVRISVINQGVRIPAEFRSKMFTPFSQVAPSSTRTRGGSGLGLSISRELVEQMGGTIGYESAKDGKTTFWFTVPLSSAGAAVH